MKDPSVKDATIGPEGKIIAFCGTRGVPASYGGFETAVDEISRRFVDLGHDCVVFCRRSSSEGEPDSHEGRRLSYVSGSPRRSLATFVSAFQVGWHLLRHRKDYGYVFWFNNANLPGILLTLLARIPFAVNTDGLEWRRAKWGKPFKLYYFLSSALISGLCRNLISDSRELQSYYRRTFFKRTSFIPYGVPQTRSLPTVQEKGILENYGVDPGRYFLQITRFEPDNLPLEAVRAFRESGLGASGYRFLLVGRQHDTPYTRRIMDLSGEDGILVADAVYDQTVVAVLRDNCFCYVHGNSVGGTNPALLEAMAGCARVLAIEGPFSREVLGETGMYFEPNALVPALHSALTSSESREELRERVHSRYRWETVAEEYLGLAAGDSATSRRRPCNAESVRYQAVE